MCCKSQMHAMEKYFAEKYVLDIHTTFIHNFLHVLTILILSRLQDVVLPNWIKFL